MASWSLAIIRPTASIWSSLSHFFAFGLRPRPGTSPTRDGLPLKDLEAPHCRRLRMQMWSTSGATSPSHGKERPKRPSPASSGCTRGLAFQFPEMQGWGTELSSVNRLSKNLRLRWGRCFRLPTDILTARRSRNQMWQAVGQVGYLRADCLSAQLGVSPAVLRCSQSRRRRWLASRVGDGVRVVARKLPGFARWDRLTIGPQVTNLPHNAMLPKRP